MALRVPKAELTTGLSESMIKQFGAVPEPLEVTWHNPKVAESALVFIAFSNFSTRSNTALGIESQGFSAGCEIPLAARPEGLPA